MKQLSLPPQVDNTISFQEIIQELRITEATVKNWVSTGNLIQVEPYLVCIDSYEKFKKEVVGKHKLNKRANKLHCDSTDIEELNKSIGKSIREIYTGTQKRTGEEISQDYENSLGVSHRNSEGVFYTPVPIVSELFSHVENITRGTTFCDPCCGSGNFLMGAIEKDIKPENIYGFDIDNTAVEIAKARIYEKTGYKTSNIKTRDFLKTFSERTHRKKYDLIFTNPPWGKKYDSSLKEKYAKIFNNGIKIDSAALFALACLRSLNHGGYMGLLLPEAFFNVSAYKSARKNLMRYQITHITDHKKPFEGLQTGAQSIILRNRPLPQENRISCKFGKQHWQRQQKDFLQNPNYIYNFYAPDSVAETIKHLFNIPHITLEGNAKWALGIVTGNNKKFLLQEKKAGYVPVYKGSDILKGNFKEPSNFIPEDFSQYQQVAPIEFYQAKEKIVYRFINANLVFACDNEQRFFLNSANIIIPGDTIGINCEMIAFLMNTKLMNWLFQNIFRTHKILRSDLESLPIFTEYFYKNKNYSEKGLYDYLSVIEDKNGTFRIKRQYL